MKNTRKNNQYTIDNIKEMSREELEFFCLNLSANNESINNELMRAREIIELFKKNNFGKSSEKINPDQLSLFDEAEVESDLTSIEPDIEEVVEVLTKKIKKKKSRKMDLAKLETTSIEYNLLDEERVCPECQGPLHHIKYQIRKELIYLPPRVEVKEYKQELCSCRNCQSNSEQTPMILAKAPKPLIKGSFASASLLANIINDKYDKAIPLYRQEVAFKRLGIDINRQNMSNWLINISENYFYRMYDYMHEQLLKLEHIGADETSVNVLHEDGKESKSKSYMWLYMSGRSEKKQIVLYDYQPNRNHIHASNFLKDYSGLLTSDGYKAYLNIAQASNVGCWAHARRYFIKSKDTIKPELFKGSQTAKFLELIAQLYRIEKKIKKFDYDKVKEYRIKEAKPIVDEIFENAHAYNNTGTIPNKFTEAITYLINQEEYLREYLNDGRLEIDNNYVEQMIRPFTIGRKNWLFMNTSRGARSSAVIYSLVNSAKLNKLKPFDYFNYILEILPNIDINDDEELEKLMPYSDLPEKLYEEKAKS